MPDSRVKIATATPTITSGAAYATGNVIGGMLTFAGLADRGFSVVLSAAIIDQSGQNAAVDLFLFNQALTSTITDKTAAALSAADNLKCVGVISNIGTDYASTGTGSVCGKSGKVNLFLGVAGSVDNNLYGLLVSRGTPTYTSTTAISVTIAAEIPSPG